MGQKVKITKIKRVRQYGGNTGMIQCNMCRGTGVVPDGHKKKTK